SPPDARGQRRLLCTNSEGTLVPIDSNGQRGADEVRLPGLMLETITTADLGGSQKWQLCALARNTDGDPLVVGISPRGEEAWHYNMPPGFYRTPVEPLTTAWLSGPEKAWLIAGPDGSIHWLAADGKLIDSFHYGTMLSGVASARFGDASVLI